MMHARMRNICKDSGLVVWKDTRNTSLMKTCFSFLICYINLTQDCPPQGFYMHWNNFLLLRTGSVAELLIMASHEIFQTNLWS